MNENAMNATLDLSKFEEGKAALIAALPPQIPDQMKPMIAGQFVTLALMN